MTRTKSSYSRIGRWAASVFVCFGMMGLLVMHAGAQTQDQPNVPPTINPAPIEPNVQQNPGVSNDITPRQPSTQNGITTTTTVTTQQEPAGTQRRVPGAETTQEGKVNRLPAVPEPLTEFQRMVASTMGRQLPIFGASLFAADVPTTFAPVDDIPVAPDYVIGPGDELRLQVWGQVNQQGSFVVDRTGAISVPQLGTVHVAGQRYGQLNDFLRNEFGRVYRNFNLDVTMGQLRSIQVFVVGHARRPGSYTISSLSTLLNALFASGGPTPQGSLRDIQVMRGTQTVVHFDLYDLLLHGDKSKDVPLSPGDVIFIPAVGPEVALLGSVNTPAIYELKKGAGAETTVGELLELGGGRTSSAAGSQVRLERIVDQTALSVIDVDLSKPDRTVLQNGDIVSVISIVDRFKNAVTLRGNVANPGRYVWFSGMRVSDLIPNKEALVTRNYWEKRNQLGQPPRDYQPEQRDTNTSGSLQVRGTDQNASSDKLTPGAPARTSQTGGAVGSALAGTDGVFTAKTDVVLSAPDINWSYAVIERQSASDLTTSLLSFNLGKIILNGDQSQNLELLPGDVVTIFSTSDLRVPSSQQTRFVRLEGEFTAAGVYSVRPGETLRQLLTRAGGLTPEAYLYASEFTRQSTKRIERQRLSEYADQLDAQLSAVTSGQEAKALNAQDAAAAGAQATSAQAAIARLRQIEPVGRIVLPLTPDSRSIDDLPDMALEDGDRFVVPRVPSSVHVEGQVYSANAFVFERDRQVRDYLKMAGGPSREADAKRTFVLRADGSVYSQQYGDLPKARVFPGDTIVVPLQLQHKAILRTLVDIATIAGQFGIAIAAITVLK